MGKSYINSAGGSALSSVKKFSVKALKLLNSDL